MMPITFVAGIYFLFVFGTLSKYDPALTGGIFYTSFSFQSIIVGHSLVPHTIRQHFRPW